MKAESIRLAYTICTFEELSEKDKCLLEKAKEATYTSFSPFSHFCVGAAVELENGEVMQGSNQENASFTTGLCAERCVIFYANARYPDVPVKTIAIAARDTSGEFTANPTSPCGACRQVLSEIEYRYNKPMRVLLYGKEHVWVLESVSDLLPFKFNASSL